MIQIAVGTSRPRCLWPAEHWKTLFDSLSAKGAKHDPRLRYPELASVLEAIVEERSGRFYPKSETPFEDVDDSEVRMIRVVRVPTGSEFVRFEEGHLPDTRDWRTLEVPFFGTIGDSLYEKQSQRNSSAVLSMGHPLAVPVALHVGFSLSRSRRNRDLDNLFDPLGPAFNRFFSTIQDLLLFKTEPRAEKGEVLAFAHQATTGLSRGKSEPASEFSLRAGRAKATRLHLSGEEVANMASTVAEAIKKAMLALGGEASSREVTAWINEGYPGQWKDISTAMADLTYPGNPSSGYAVSQRFLERVARGRYRLRK